MELNDLYQFVLLIVLVGMILGVGLLVLAKFSASSSVTGTAETALNNTITALAEIASSWLGLIITIAILALILTLVVRSFVIRR